MLQAFVFNETAVVVRHWFEILEDEEEHGTRVELRRLVRHPHRGTESAPQVIELDELIWRADLFDLIGAEPGGFQRAHFHVNYEGIEPIDRSYDEELSADPFAWLERELGDVEAILRLRSMALEDPAAEAQDIRRALPAIMRAAREAAGERCTSAQQCLEATRDTTEIVALMLSLFRSDAPGGPRDPRLAPAA